MILFIFYIRLNYSSSQYCAVTNVTLGLKYYNLDERSNIILPTLNLRPCKLRDLLLNNYRFDILTLMTIEDIRVRIPIDIMACSIPNQSEMMPAIIAPKAYPKSLHSRNVPILSAL
jgi:hypothetical protein